MVADSAPLLDVVSDRFLQISTAAEGEPAVVLTLPDSLARRLDHARWRRQIGVEIFEPQHLWILSGGGGHLVDAEPRDL